MITEAFRLDNGPILPGSNFTWGQAVVENRELLEYWKTARLSGSALSTETDHGSMDMSDKMSQSSMSSMGEWEDGSWPPFSDYLIDIPFSFQLKEDLLGGNLESFELPPTTTPTTLGLGRSNRGQYPALKRRVTRVYYWRGRHNDGLNAELFILDKEAAPTAFDKFWDVMDRAPGATWTMEDEWA